MGHLVRILAAAVGLGVAAADPARAEDAPSDLIVTGLAGRMTDEPWQEAIRAWDADFVDSWLVGLAVGRDLAGRGRLAFGYEVQLVAHFGAQDHLEVNLPLVVRYDRAGQRVEGVSSLAFGLGLSWASERPGVEIARDGETTRTLIYWMAEIGVDLPGSEAEGVLRLHHRSDGFGAFPVDAGSNALVVGIRRRF